MTVNDVCLHLLVVNNHQGDWSHIVSDNFNFIPVISYHQRMTFSGFDSLQRLMFLCHHLAFCQFLLRRLLFLPLLQPPNPSLALIPALQWQPQAHLMHQLSGQDSSLAGRGGWKSEISHRLNILTWNLCWWWLQLPSSDPSVASSLERIVLQHWRDYDLAVVSHSDSLSFPRCPRLCSKDFWVTIISERDFADFLSPFVPVVQPSLLSRQDRSLKVKWIIWSQKWGLSWPCLKGDMYMRICNVQTLTHSYPEIGWNGAARDKG